jgi:seryl-tRNA synthetase
MTEVPLLDLEKMPGYHWHPNGQSSLSGDLLELFRSISLPWNRWRKEFGAVEYECPTFLAADAMGKMKYFNSFPQLVTFAVNLDEDVENLKAFSKSKTVEDDGSVHSFKSAPIRNAMTPAPCYHLYPQFSGSTLEKATFLGTKNATFRREAYYQPLVRQWNYHSEEIVCLGDLEEVRAFLVEMPKKWDEFFKSIGLPVTWKSAADPFFNPGQNPSAILQNLDPVKKELTLGDKLALGSANFHRNFFCEAFNIRRNGKTAFSGCVGWGIERIMYAFLTHFGYERKNWPDLEKMYGD